MLYTSLKHLNVIPKSTFDIRIQVILHFVQNELNFVFGGLGMVRYFARCISGTSYRLLLPRQEEYNTTIRCRRIQQAHLFGTAIELEQTLSINGDGRTRSRTIDDSPIVAGKHDMHTGAGATDFVRLRVIHLANGIGEGTGGVDHAFGFHVPFLPRELLLHSSTADLSILVLQKFLDANVVGDGGSVSSGRHCDGQAHTGVILLAYEENCTSLVRLKSSVQVW